MSKLERFFRSKAFDLVCFALIALLLLAPIVMFNLGIGFTKPF